MLPHLDETLEKFRAGVTGNIMRIMNLFVMIQAASIVECLRAHTTLKWLISRMNQKVKVEILFWDKLKAGWTFQFSFDALMLYSFVICQPLRTFENFLTHITKSSYSRVPFLMVVHAARVVERFGTELTLVGLSVCVNNFVLFQLFVGLIVSLTYITDWWIIVKINMTVQIVLILECFFTVGTF